MYACNQKCQIIVVIDQSIIMHFQFAFLPIELAQNCTYNQYGLPVIIKWQNKRQKMVTRDATSCTQHLKNLFYLRGVEQHEIFPDENLDTKSRSQVLPLIIFLFIVVRTSLEFSIDEFQTSLGQKICLTLGTLMHKYWIFMEHTQSWQNW